VKQQVAQALHGLGETNKAIDIVKDLLRRMNNKKDSEKITTKVQRKTSKASKNDEGEPKSVVDSGTTGGVTSLLYGWSSCRPDSVVCCELLKHLIRDRARKHQRR
jgi:hypothetical protein